MGKKNWIQWLMIFVMAAGAAAILYPLGSDLYQKYRHSQVIQHYQQQTQALDHQLADEGKKQAAAYNKRIKERVKPTIRDPFAGDAKADPEGIYDLYQGLLGKTIGVLRIPKIDVDLPIYFGTNPAILEKGAGVIPGTSLPTGGKSTHSVITAHRGLQKARLFTDLPELKKGDHFFIDENQQTLAYEVDQIMTVLPNESQYLAVAPDKDYVTLLTCTPLGVNTHRLLVRGHRVPYQAKEEQVSVTDKAGQWFRTYQPLLIVSGITLVLGLLTWYFRRDRRKHDQQ